MDGSRLKSDVGRVVEDSGHGSIYQFKLGTEHQFSFLGVLVNGGNFIFLYPGERMAILTKLKPSTCRETN